MFVRHPACWVSSSAAGVHRCSVTPAQSNSHQPSSRTSICSFIPIQNPSSQPSLGSLYCHTSTEISWCRHIGKRVHVDDVDDRADHAGWVLDRKHKTSQQLRVPRSFHCKGQGFDTSRAWATFSQFGSIWFASVLQQGRRWEIWKAANSTNERLILQESLRNKKRGEKSLNESRHRPQHKSNVVRGFFIQVSLY